MSHWSMRRPGFITLLPADHQWAVYAAYRNLRFALQHGVNYLFSKANATRQLKRIGCRYLSSRSAFEVHLVTCHRDIPLALWALASWYGVGHRSDPVVIHDDGSLTPPDYESIRAMFPEARIISRSEADDIVATELSRFPAIRTYRALSPLAIKLIDVPLMSACERFILMDSDVFTFSSLSNLETRLPASGNSFLRDYQFALTVGRDVFVRFAAENGYLPINTGFAVIERQTLDPDCLEHALTVCPDIYASPSWAEQTLYALLSSRRGTHFLGPDFVVAQGQCLENVKVKHYVSLCRGFAYVEGVPQLSRLLFQERSIPPEEVLTSVPNQ